MPAQATGHYSQPAVMTAPGTYQPPLADLPRGIAAPGGVAHGLIHERADDPRLHVPATVYNAVPNRPEPVLPPGML
jgi:hypothetical protein